MTEGASAPSPRGFDAPILVAEGHGRGYFTFGTQTMPLGVVQSCHDFPCGGMRSMLR